MPLLLCPSGGPARPSSIWAHTFNPGPPPRSDSWRGWDDDDDEYRRKKRRSSIFDIFD
jgi:hypothetical protein